MELTLWTSSLIPKPAVLPGDYTQWYPWFGCHSPPLCLPHPPFLSVFILNMLVQTTKSSSWIPKTASRVVTQILLSPTTHDNHIFLPQVVQWDKNLIILLLQLKSLVSPLGAREESRFWAGLPWLGMFCFFLYTRFIWTYNLQEYLTAPHYSFKHSLAWSWWRGLSVTHGNIQSLSWSTSI